MRRDVLFATGLSAVLLAGCGPKGSSVTGPLPPAPADRAVVLATTEGDFHGGVALWQGFEHAWRYNHRVNRVGSILEQSGNGCPQTGDDPLCEVEFLVECDAKRPRPEHLQWQPDPKAAKVPGQLRRQLAMVVGPRIFIGRRQVVGGR